MASDYIQSLLEEGRPGPSGVFSLELSRVELAFASGGQDWLHYWLRFAHFYWSESFEISWDGRNFSLFLPGPGPDSEGLRALLLDRRRGPRYLALGMLAAAAQGFHQIELECPRGFLRLQGQRSQLDEQRRRRDGGSRLLARRHRALAWPNSQAFMAPYQLNGQLQQPLPGTGLRLLVDGWAFPASGFPLLPPQESLDWPADEAQLDARLLNPRLNPEQVKQLQGDFAKQLLARDSWCPETVEWLLLRDPGLQTRLPVPPQDHPLYPAYRERQAWLAGESAPRQLWLDWPESCWPRLLDQGLAPFGLADWLRDTCRQLPGRAVYPYLLRHSWRGEHADPDLLSALLAARQDTLAGQVLLASQLKFLRPAQRPARAAQFCRDFLEAARAGQEAPEQWHSLPTSDQEQIDRLLREDL
ncbi:MAG: hypothetical protein U0931_04330 [Vulcanimicrobiota bacterium]